MVSESNYSLYLSDKLFAQLFNKQRYFSIDHFVTYDPKAVNGVTGDGWSMTLLFRISNSRPKFPKAKRRPRSKRKLQENEFELGLGLRPAYGPEKR